MEIVAPPFPRGLTWFNTAPLRMDQQRHRPVLVEFWEMTMPQSMRTMPYLAAWHDRYADRGLRVVGVHTPASPMTAADEVVEAAVARLGIDYPVVNDPEGELWSFYGATGYPSRYIWDGDFRLVDLQIGEGEYEAAELLLQGLLDGPDGHPSPLAPLRPEDAPGALVEQPTEPTGGPHSGAYRAGGVWVSLSGTGTIAVDGDEIAVEGPAAIELRSHPVSTEATISISPGPGVEVIATVFTPGLVPGSATD